MPPSPLQMTAEALSSHSLPLSPTFSRCSAGHLSASTHLSARQLQQFEPGVSLVGNTLTRSNWTPCRPAQSDKSHLHSPGRHHCVVAERSAPSLVQSVSSGIAHPSWPSSHATSLQPAPTVQPAEVALSEQPSMTPAATSDDI